MSTERPTDPLIRYLARRTPRRFARLVRETRQHVLDAAFRVTGDRALAEDVTQEVYLKLLVVDWKPEDVRSGPGLLASTAVLKARSILRGEIRRRDRERRAAEASGAAGAARSAPAHARSSDDLVTEVRDAVLALPERLRSFVELRYFGGLALAEIAATLDTPPRTVNARLKEARDRLRERLETHLRPAILPLLAPDDAAPISPPSIDVSDELGRKLERIAREGVGAASAASVAGRAPFSATSPATWAIAGGLLILVAVGCFQALGERATPRVARTPEPPPATTGAQPLGVANPEVADAPAAPPADAAESPRPAPVVEPSPTRAIIAVEDERGRLVREGQLHFDLSWRALLDVASLSVDAQLRLLPYESLLSEPVNLSEANPFVLDDLPRELTTLDIVCRATTSRQSPSDDATIRLRPGEENELRLVVHDPRAVEVFVFDEGTGEPIESARVISVTELKRRRVRPAKYLEHEGAGATIAGADGRALLMGLGPGAHDLEVHAGSARFATARLEENARTIDIPVGDAPVTGSIRALVGLPDGTPVTDMKVELRIDGQGASRTERSDADGACVFDRVPSGTHVISVGARFWGVVRAQPEEQRAAYICLNREVVVRPAERRDVHVGYYRGRGRIDARIVDALGRPVPGELVSLTMRTAYSPIVLEGESNLNGIVTFERLPRGRFVARWKDWTYPEIEITDGESEFATWRTGEVAIRGRVLLEPVQEPRVGPSASESAAGEERRRGDITEHIGEEERRSPAVDAAARIQRGSWTASWEDGGPAPNDVSVHASQGNRTAVVELDDAGRFVIAGVAAGSCEISTFSFRHESQRRTIVAERETTEELELVVRARSSSTDQE